MSSSTIKRVIKIVIFCVLTVSILHVLSLALEPKNNGPDDGMRYPELYGFLSEPKGSIDVIVIGSSNAAAGCSPIELWQNYGYTSYVSGEIWQNLAHATFILNKAILYQKPKLIVLDTDELYHNQGDAWTTILYENFPLLKYHNRWKKFQFENIFKKIEYTAHYPFKGQKMNVSVNPYSNLQYMTYSPDVEHLPLFTEFLLDKFIKICKEKKIDIIFVTFPSVQWDYKMHNGIQDYVQKKNIPYIDMNVVAHEIGLDWTLHTRDKGEHLNCQGAVKTSRYLGEKLKELFFLPDHRNNPSFSKWNEDSLLYREFLSKAQ